MSEFIDMVGVRFGRLTVLELAKPKLAPSGQVKTQWRCACDCGKETTVTASNLRRLVTSSCGCLHREATSRSRSTHGCSRPKRWTKEYRAWAAMLQRCGNPNATAYKHYGGRGITVCPEWREFEVFLSDIGMCPEGMTLGRINNDGNYEPGNVRWESTFQQGNNRRSNHIITALGKSMTIRQWSRETGIKSATIGARVRVYGWSNERAVTQPVSR